MSKYPENVTLFPPIEPKLGIKSSLPNAKQAIAFTYLLWKINPVQNEVLYSEETVVNGIIRLVPQNDTLAALRMLFNQNNIDVNQDRLSQEVNKNSLFDAQIEHLNVAFELIWKLCHFDFFVTDRPFSAERTGRNRYKKKILFSTNVDIFDTIVEQRKEDYLRVLYSWLLHIDLDADLERCEKSLVRVLTCFSEDAYYQIRNNESRILFRNYEMYKAILEDESAILTGQQENTGPLRILCSSLNEDLNKYVCSSRDNGRTLANKRQNISEESFSAYCNRVENMLKASVPKDFDSGDAEEGNIGAEIPQTPLATKQIIYYGVPGCGKSHEVNADVLKELSERRVDAKEYHKVRCVFHSEYSNADFVGQIYPYVKPNNEGVEYRFKPGPFSIAVRRAFRNPTEPFFLIIEEINRGNAAAIFGEMFQLLDRIKPGDEPDSSTGNTYGGGWSSYGVDNIDVNAYIRQISPDNLERGYDANVPYGENISFGANTAVRLPPNLSIYATMNTSDQNVVAMDNAFQRRFKSKMIRNNLENVAQYNIKIERTNVYWGAFRKWVNDIILSTPGISKADDKCLGGWFIGTPVERSEVGEDGKVKVIKYKDISREDFAEKVIKYLWDDVFKRNAATVIFKKGMGNDEFKSLSELVDAFEKEPRQGIEAFDKVFKLGNKSADLSRAYNPQQQDIPGN